MVPIWLLITTTVDQNAKELNIRRWAEISQRAFHPFLTVKCISRYLPTHCLVATVVQEPVWIIETRTVLAPALMTCLRVRIQSSINSAALLRGDAKHGDAHLLRGSAQVREGNPPTAHSKSAPSASGPNTGRAHTRCHLHKRWRLEWRLVRAGLTLSLPLGRMDLVFGDLRDSAYRLPGWGLPLWLFWSFCGFPLLSQMHIYRVDWNGFQGRSK